VKILASVLLEVKSYIQEFGEAKDKQARLIGEYLPLW
jgi:hypothetical protein